MIIIDFVSKLINYEFPVIEKPTYLRSIINQTTHENTAVTIRGFSYDFKALVKNECFVNDYQTFISCSIDIKNKEFDIFTLIENVASYFYKPFFPNEEAPVEYKELTLYSTYFFLFQTRRALSIKFDEQHFEIIPNEDEIIINFLIDNSALVKKINDSKMI